MNAPRRRSCSSPTSTRRAATPARSGPRRWRGTCAGSGTTSRCSPPPPTARPRRRRAASTVDRRHRSRLRPGRARPHARPRPRRLAVRLGHLLGPAAPARQGDRPGAARRRLGAVRRSPRPPPAARARLRLRDHDLAAGVGPPRRPGGPARRRRLGRRPARRLDLRAAPAPFPHQAPAPCRRAHGAPLLARADAVVAVSRPVVDDLARREIAEGILVPNGWDADAGAADAVPRPRGAGRRAARPRPRLARLHGPLRQLRPRPAPADRGLARSPRPTRRPPAGWSS